MNRQRTSDIFDICSKPRFIFVDFDHTLLGGNSTELFITNSRPRALVSSLDFIVRNCIPWRLILRRNSFRLRDYVLCRLLFSFMPWTLNDWQATGPSVFEKLSNLELDRTLAHALSNDLSIITFGMDDIVRPMLRGSRWEGVSLLATPRAAGLGYFAMGKLAMAKRAFSSSTIEQAMLITDSEDDLDLLQAVRYPILIEPFRRILCSYP